MKWRSGLLSEFSLDISVVGLVCLLWGVGGGVVFLMCFFLFVLFFFALLFNAGSDVARPASDSMYRRMTLNSLSSCFHLSNAGILVKPMSPGYGPFSIS